MENTFKVGQLVRVIGNELRNGFLGELAVVDGVRFSGIYGVRQELEGTSYGVKASDLELVEGGMWSFNPGYLPTAIEGKRVHIIRQRDLEDTLALTDTFLRDVADRWDWSITKHRGDILFYRVLEEDNSNPEDTEMTERFNPIVEVSECTEAQLEMLAEAARLAGYGIGESPSNYDHWQNYNYFGADCHYMVFWNYIYSYNGAKHENKVVSFAEALREYIEQAIALQKLQSKPKRRYIKVGVKNLALCLSLRQVCGITSPESPTK